MGQNRTPPSWTRFCETTPAQMCPFRYAILFTSKRCLVRAFRSSFARISVVRRLRRSDAQDGQEQDEALLKADLGGIRSTGRNRASRKQHSKETGDSTFTP
jgi:hypothetical protein